VAVRNSKLLAATRWALLTACLIPWAPAHAAEERLDIDPVVRGVWSVHAISKDKGETVERVEPAQMLCRVGATKVRMANGTEMNVEKVVIMEDQQGNPMNAVRFDSGVVWGISKKPGQPYVLVQVFDGTDFHETLRVLVTVQH
jgi:hypothetical protein